MKTALYILPFDVLDTVVYCLGLLFASQDEASNCPASESIGDDCFQYPPIWKLSLA